MKKHLYFTFGDLTCQIEGPTQQINYIQKCYLKSPFAQHLNLSTPSTRISAKLTISLLPPAKEEKFILKSYPRNSRYHLQCSENLFFIFPIIEQVLRKIFYILFFKNGGLVLHASAVASGNKAAVFLGPSGSGKSTIAAKLQSESRQNVLLADNNTYLLPSPLGFVILPPAFLEWNLTTGNKLRKKYCVDRFFFLKKSDKTIIKSLTITEAYKLLFQEVQIPSTSLTEPEVKETKANLLKLVSSLSTKHSLNRFSFCLKDKLTPIVFATKPLHKNYKNLASTVDLKIKKRD
jgi:hypothetical protein